MAKEMEGIEECAATRHNLRSTSRHQIESSELLEDPHRIISAEHGHGACQPDALRASGGSGEDYRRRWSRKTLAVMLADAKYIKTDLVGESDLLNQFRDALGRSEAPGSDPYIRERVNADLHDAPGLVHRWRRAPGVSP
jgi:hypothetical protein